MIFATINRKPFSIFLIFAENRLNRFCPLMSKNGAGIWKPKDWQTAQFIIEFRRSRNFSSICEMKSGWWNLFRLIRRAFLCQRRANLFNRRASRRYRAKSWEDCSTLLQITQLISDPFIWEIMPSYSFTSQREDGVPRLLICAETALKLKTADFLSKPRWRADFSLTLSSTMKRLKRLCLIILPPRTELIFSGTTNRCGCGTTKAQNPGKIKA